MTDKEIKHNEVQLDVDALTNRVTFGKVQKQLERNRRG